MIDGDKVTDVDIMTNTRKGVTPRCIMTFENDTIAMDFANQLKNLCAKFDMFSTTEVTD